MHYRDIDDPNILRTHLDESDSHQGIRMRKEDDIVTRDVF